MPTEDGFSTSPEKHDTDLRSSVNNVINCGSVQIPEDISNQNIDIVDSQEYLDNTLANLFEESLNVSDSSDEPCLDINSSNLQSVSTESLKVSSKSPIISHESDPQSHKRVRYACKRNGKRIFADQDKEDTFFETFDGLIDNALHNQPVSANQVLLLASNSKNFRSLWDDLVLKFGNTMALKKVTDKIRTFARYHR